MRTLEYTFDTLVEFSDVVREHAFVLHCLPRRGEGATVLRESFRIEPDMRYMRQRDSFDNELVAGSAREPHDRIGYHSEGVVRMDLSSPAIVSAHPLFKYPSPSAPADEAIEQWARGLGLAAEAFADGGKGALAAFENLGHAVHEVMAYEPGSTTVNTTASEAFAARSGVCQDFAHIMIVALRSVGVPARYVSGLAVGEGVTHAWAQAHIDGVWHGYDPTRDQRIDEAYLPFAIGRDWSDCPIERGSFWGLVDQTQTVFMTMREV
ncbi:MAG: transglutaminase family protein [Eggerthellaceae bacterium]|nr:transglutaminase family protein [Eggerthellaceae bacterium]